MFVWDFVLDPFISLCDLQQHNSLRDNIHFRILAPMKAEITHFNQGKFYNDLYKHFDVQMKGTIDWVALEPKQAMEACMWLSGANTYLVFRCRNKPSVAEEFINDLIVVHSFQKMTSFPSTVHKHKSEVRLRPKDSKDPRGDLYSIMLDSHKDVLNLQLCIQELVVEEVDMYIQIYTSLEPEPS